MSWRDTEIKMGAILFATDFSVASDKALQYATFIASHYGAKLCLFHVVSSAGLDIAGPEAIAAATRAAARDAEHLQTQLIERGVVDKSRCGVVVRQGDIRNELEQVLAEQHFDLVVLGTHSRTGIGRLVLGSVAEQIFRSASCPVLTVGQNAPERCATAEANPDSSLLFATDFSYKSLAALRYAIALAEEHGLRLVLLHVLSPVPPSHGKHIYTADDVIRMRAEAQRTALARLQQLTAHTQLRRQPSYCSEFGETAETILSTADSVRARVIVMGLHHTTSIDTASHVPWSTAFKVVCHAKCPVLTVRT
jgi:nucleotide-binding universal stress UspA family protein